MMDPDVNADAKGRNTSGSQFSLITTVRRLRFWVLLTPLLISSSGIVCMPTGDTRLASLEIDVFGENRIAFDPALRVYDVGIPPDTTTVTIRTEAMDSQARLTWYVPDGEGMLASGTLGVGSGQVTVDLPPDGFSLYVGVFPPGRAVDTYIATFAPCSSNCNDGDDCTADVCDPANGSCSNPVEVDGMTCDFGGLPGMCASGTCEEAPLCAGVDCSDGQECTIDICNPADGSCSHTDEPAGTTCDDGLGPLSGACDGSGACQDICGFNAPCPDPGVQCQVASCDSVDGFCDSQAGPDGVTCDFNPSQGDGSCVGGTCIFTPPDCGTDTRVVTVGCTNSVTSAQSVFPTLLEVTVAEPVFSGAPFTATFAGVGAVPESFLDFAQGIVPGGVASAFLEGLAATVVPVNATGTPVELNVDPAAITPGPTSFCTFPTTTACSVDGDCTVPPCLPPVLVVDVLISTDCSPGGVCDTLGKNASQCLLNGFCVTGDLFAPLGADSGTFTAGASGDVLFGWATDVPGESDCPGADPRCANNGGTIPDNSIALPLANYNNPIPPIGIRVNVDNGLFVPFQCSMGANGGTCVAGASAGLGCLTDVECPASFCDLTVDDVIVDIDPADLFACPIN